MQTAPAYSSIICPTFLASLVKENYFPSKTITCQILKTGINHTYLITYDQQKYILRIYFKNWRTEDEINEELNLIDYLKQNGLTVSYGIPNLYNKKIVPIESVEGRRYAVLFSFADGETIRIPSEKVFYNTGVYLGQMHKLLINKECERITYTTKNLVQEPLELAKQFFEEDDCELHYFEKSLAIINQKFKGIDTDNTIKKGIVHLDIWYENFKVVEDNTITLFDFDNVGNGWLFLDVAYFLMINYRNEPDKNIFKQKEVLFLEGYQSIIPLSSQEKALIPYGGLAIWFHYTGIHIKRFNDFSNQFFSKEFFKYWVHTVNQWMLYHGIKI